MIGTAVDASTILVLAAVALAEGLARVPAGAIVLRRFLNQDWQIEGPTGPGDRVRLVHWWPPWTETLVVSPRSSGSVLVRQADLAARIAAITPVYRAARVVGAISLILLVIGVPVGFAWAGAIGGLSAFGGVLAGQFGLGFLGWRGLAALQAPRGDRARLLAVSLNPFAAPATASRLLAAAIVGGTPRTVARTLLSPERWAAWFRPQAYDASVAHDTHHDLVQELEAADDAVREVLALQPATVSDGLWCPRCAATYLVGATVCADCDIGLLKSSQTVVPVARLRPKSTLS